MTLRITFFAFLYHLEQSQPLSSHLSYSSHFRSSAGVHTKLRSNASGRSHQCARRLHVTSALATHGALYLADHCTQGQQPRHSCAPPRLGIFRRSRSTVRAARGILVRPVLTLLARNALCLILTLLTSHTVSMHSSSHASLHVCTRGALPLLPRPSPPHAPTHTRQDTWTMTRTRTRPGAQPGAEHAPEPTVTIA